MPERAPVSKKLRFEIFKRDSFACQYCGRKAPDVVLHCDHIKPVVEGGETNILNLITSCVACNLGKGPRSLSDQSALIKQQDQLAELQARREQIEMMIDWRSGLEQLKQDAVDEVSTRWSDAAEQTVSLTKTGKDKLRKLLKEYGLDLVLRAIPEAIDSYARRGNKDEYTKDSLDWAFTKLGGVCRVLRDSADKPWPKQAFYIRGILRARLSYVDDRAVISLIEDGVSRGIALESVERFAKEVRNWTEFRSGMETYIENNPPAEK